MAFTRLAALARVLPVAAVAALAATAALAQLPGPDAPPSFADLAARLSPAVVNISTATGMGEPEPEMPEIPPGAPFEDLFRDFFERHQQGPRSVSSLGSGFVIDPSGLVVTNNHVIENADEITVNFPDGTALEATLVGRDPKTDLAVLKIEPAAPLAAVPFGNSDSMRVGDWVMAIGNPFGLGGSVSAGIISAQNRDINAGPYDSFIQTDAAINRGNSGGPLFNMAGEVIGVNTAIISPTGGSIGIGFAVPSNLARTVVAQLREFGETRRGWLGVRIQTVTPELAESLSLPKASGALVAEVTPDGPAAVAGIEAGDVIVRFDGREVPSMRELPRMVADTAVGERVPVDVVRRGETKTVMVDLGRLEEGEAIEAAAAAPGAAPEAAPPATETVLGLTLEALTAERRAELDLPDDVNGVFVSAVEAGGPAAEKGMRPGDVIVEVGQEPVASPADVAARVEATRADGRRSALFLVRNGEELRFVAIPLDGR
jgi:serine protease Do